MTQREEASKITIQATGATSWRRNDVKYRKNEAFVDVVETVNLSMSSKGTHALAGFLTFSTIHLYDRTVSLLSSSLARDQPADALPHRHRPPRGRRRDRKSVV